jgi:16S rRNA (guanine966-N2)-methyltransferase
LRIIAGQHKGRRLLAPEGEEVRPTSDRAREALFNILEHGDVPVEGARFLDLFSGTGAVGLEAASRGAATVLMVENSREALGIARSNIEKLGEKGRVQVVSTDACRLGAGREPFNIVFLDPPYRSGLAERTLEHLLDRGWIDSNGRVIVELAAKEPFDCPAGYRVEEERRYGAGRFVFLRIGTESATVEGVERTLRRG